MFLKWRWTIENPKHPWWKHYHGWFNNANRYKLNHSRSHKALLIMVSCLRRLVSIANILGIFSVFSFRLVYRLLKAFIYCDLNPVLLFWQLFMWTQMFEWHKKKDDTKASHSVRALWPWCLTSYSDCASNGNIGEFDQTILVSWKFSFRVNCTLSWLIQKIMSSDTADLGTSTTWLNGIKHSETWHLLMRYHEIDWRHHLVTCFAV